MYTYVYTHIYKYILMLYVCIKKDEHLEIDIYIYIYTYRLQKNVRSPIFLIFHPSSARGRRQLRRPARATPGTGVATVTGGLGSQGALEGPRYGSF